MSPLKTVYWKMERNTVLKITNRQLSKCLNNVLRSLFTYTCVPCVQVCGCAWSGGFLKNVYKQEGRIVPIDQKQWLHPKNIKL